MTGIDNSFRIYKVTFDVWQGAPSITITVLCLQYLFSLSSLRTRCLKNISMIWEFVFDCVSDRQTLPLRSMPVIIDILGYITRDGKELVSSLWNHFMLLKSLIPSHVSSTFIKLSFFFQRSMNSIAHYWRRIKFCIELIWTDALIIFLYFIFKFSFIILKTS